MKFYLAARYDRIEEMRGYRDHLIALGHEVTSRWLNGSTKANLNGEVFIEGREGTDYTEIASVAGADFYNSFARNNIADVLEADTIIFFSESVQSARKEFGLHMSADPMQIYIDIFKYARGGRHVELGIALVSEKGVMVCGYHENIFTWLSTIYHANNWIGIIEIIKSNPVLVAYRKDEQ